MAEGAKARLGANMPIQGRGWELLITRIRVDSRGDRKRTVGNYQAFHNGTPAQGLFGMCAETRGPGDNSHAGNNRRIAAGRYPLLTQDGAKYVTIGYTANTNPNAIPRPGLDVGNTNKRVGILIHPGRGFLSSIGCINPAKALPKALTDIDFADSRARVIALIEDLKKFDGNAFPKENGHSIPDAFFVVDGEP
jgi:hypothetical protein